MIELEFGINGTFGHLAGDIVLPYFTRAIKNNIRTNDEICGYGGEEFVIIFEDCTIENPAKITKRIRLIVENDIIPFN